MSYYNQITLIGNIGQEPEVKTFDNGGKLASFSLATSKSYKPKDSNEFKTITQWHKIVVKNKNIIEYTIEQDRIKKGVKVLLTGELETREYKDKDGNMRQITEVVINIGHTLKTLSTSQKSENTESNDETIDDDMPF